jgi:hypothetical protein
MQLGPQAAANIIASISRSTILLLLLRLILYDGIVVVVISSMRVGTPPSCRSRIRLASTPPIQD